MSFCPSPVGRLALLGAALTLFSSPTFAQNPTVNWRSDYNSARKEAVESGKPMLVEIGTENCFYCKKMQATTLQDAGIVELLNSRFIPLKVDANAEPALVQALRIQMYPTTVLAGPDGKIHGFLQGYVSAEQLKDHAERAVLAVTTPDWVARDLQEANKAIGTSDYTRAVSLLKGITTNAKNSPAKTKATQVLAELEQSAANRLARVKVLESQGELTAATNLLTEIMRTYAGTQAATDASVRLSGLANHGAPRDRLRVSRARDLLASAREEFQAERFADCLNHCSQLTALYVDLPEAADAKILADQVQSDPHRLAKACHQVDQRAAAMHLALADAWLAKGDSAEAKRNLEKVTRTWPDSRQAMQAQIVLTKMQKGDGSVLAGFSKAQ
ncbi:MAG: thioredoxin family protein [Bacteroidales bacterium]|nr:thioredoxin family protein [Bacteroidales bacterium]